MKMVVYFKTTIKSENMVTVMLQTPKHYVLPLEII
jgi:hypothetical protein